jgi:membrane protein required for colicin V production
MNVLDVAILILSGLLIVRGFFRGIVQGAATLLGVIFSFVIASFYYRELAGLAAPLLPRHQTVLAFFCFVFLFFTAVLFFNFLSILARKAVHLTLLGWLDRALGGLFGLVKAAVILFVMVTILTVFYPKTGFLVENSRFFPAILKVTGKLTTFIPSKIKNDFMNKKKDLQDFWEGKKRDIRKWQRVPGDGFTP